MFHNIHMSRSVEYRSGARANQVVSHVKAGSTFSTRQRYKNFGIFCKSEKSLIMLNPITETSPYRVAGNGYGQSLPHSNCRARQHRKSSLNYVATHSPMKRVYGS